MPTATLLRRTLCAPRALAFTLLALISAVPVLAVTTSTIPTNVVISQLYGAGGNSGATLNADYVELFNPTANTLTLSNYSIQYASAAGATISAVINLPATITLLPGQHYLVASTAGTVGGPDNADFTSSSIAFGASAGKVYVVNTTTKLAAACPGTDPTIVDFIGYGTTASCAYTAPAPAPAATTADIRTNACVVTGNSSTEYALGAPAPHNSSSALAPCNSATGTPLSASGLATPSTLNTGSTTLLTVRVTPATIPASTGISVTANLSALSPTASSTQQFYDDGINGGDLVAGDNVFSYTATVTNPGTFSLPVTIADTQLRSTSTTIALTATAPPPTVSIRALQSAKPSPYAAQKVTTSGIVVSIKSTGFYLEAKDADTNPTTPEGILVYTGGTAIPATVTLGTEIQVSGTVANYSSTPSPTVDTEIDNPGSFSVLSTGNPLPTPITITIAQDSPSGGIYQFTKYEGMRVAIASLTTTSGTDASLNEPTETNTSNGQFYGVVTGIPRPFREPGISVTDSTYTLPIPSTVTRWDSNPELLFIDSLATGGPAIDLTSTTVLTGISGVMDFSTGAPDIILDSANRPTIAGGGLTAQPLPVQTPGEFTVGTFNMERFYTSDPNAAINPGASVVTVTPAAYQRRLQKASNAVRNILNSPDILGCQEIEDLEVLTDLAKQISTDAQAAGQVDPVYTPYLFLATDGTGINTGFLVKSTRVTTVSVLQSGLNTTFTTSTGTQAILNDRTPLVLHAGIKRPGGPDYLLTIIDVHQRSLISVDDPTSTGATVRLKREAQSEYLANLIQSYQSAGEHVITVGDFNSFQFSDGFVDTLGVDRGNPVPASQVITPPVAGITNPNLVDLVTLLPPAQQQSYVETGSAQVLDHIIVTPDILPLEDRFAYAHIDADFPLVDQNDATTPMRVSDHDPAVAYFAIPPIPVIQGTVQLTLSSTLARATGGGYLVTITLTNNGTGTAQAVQLNTATLGSATAASLPIAVGNIAPSGGTITFTVLYPATAGASGTGTTQRYGFTYTGGAFSGGYRATLP